MCSGATERVIIQISIISLWMATFWLRRVHRAAGSQETKVMEGAGTAKEDSLYTTTLHAINPRREEQLMCKLPVGHPGEKKPSVQQLRIIVLILHNVFCHLTTLHN